MRKTLLLDCDGVTADFALHTFNALPGLGVPPVTWEHFTRAWDIIEAVGTQHQEAIEAYWAAQGWCESIPLYAGAQEGVAALQEVADVYFVTTQMTHAPYWMWERMQWLKKHFAVDDRHVVFTLSKHLVLGDMLIDDKPSNVASWCKSHPTKQGVLWDQPFNRSAEVPVGATRIGSWERVLSLLSE